jgi:hypothetical protein
MKSDLMLLGAVGAIIALVVAYAMMGQTQKTSRKRTFDQTVTDPEFGEAVLVAKDPDNKTDTRFVSTNAADFGEAVAQLAQGSVAEGAAAWGAKRIRSVASVADKGQYLLGISDEQREKLEAAAMQKALAAAKLAKDKLTPGAKVVASKVAAGAKVVASKVVSGVTSGAKSLFDRVFHNTLQKK